MADDTANSPTSQCCALCGESGSSLLRCSQCQSVWYCNKACQKKHWKGGHKSSCFPPNATCTRCLEPIVTDENGVVTTPCQVPHPTHLLQDCGSMWGSGGTTLSFHCLACEKNFSKKQSERGAEWTHQPSNSSQWCFQGRHTVKPLQEGDQCRVHPNVALILIEQGQTTEEVQVAINNIDKENVRVLVIQPANGGYSEDVQPTVDLVMPNLEEIKLIDVSFSKIVLTSTTTPKLKDIEMQNVPDDCPINIQCPALEHFDGRHHHGEQCDRWVNKMLKKATHLQTFRSYKLGLGFGNRPIQFASTMLTELHIHRSDCLSDLSIWAPRLQYLRLQGCYDLENIQFPKTHPDLSKELPSNFVPTKFMVETTNSNLSNAIIETLTNHSRCVWEGEEDDETAGVGGSGMEAMFRNMHQSF